MSAFPRDFKGIWVPKELWMDKRLTIVEKCIMAEIDSLDCGEEHCYAGNDYLGLMFDLHERTISQAITKLKRLGFIEQVAFDGRVRRLKSNLKTIYEKFYGSDFMQTSSPTSRIHEVSSPAKPIDRENKTKILKKEKKKKKENSAPPRTATPKIQFNSEERKFTGITEADLKAWREKFPGLNLDKELALCAEWALTTRRDNYRKSILTWLRNVQNSRGERQFAAGAAAQTPEVTVSKEDIMANKTLATRWEDGSIGKLPHGYSIAATPTKIEFSMPGWNFELDYDMTNSEFIKLSKPALKKMRLI
jgi:DNA-binding transcriptional ArsR family regulator